MTDQQIVEILAKHGIGEAWHVGVTPFPLDGEDAPLFIAAYREMLEAARSTIAAPAQDQLRELRERALDGIAWELAHDNVGIYPAAIKGGPNAYEKRTERMEGHNECVTVFTQNYSKISDWIEQIPAEHKTLVEDMLIAEKIKISCNKEVSFWVDCSDLFFWACADGEDIGLSEFTDLAECYKLSPRYGGWLWCAKKRGMRPQTACYPYIPKEQWHLFDAAGPERDDPDGRGRAALDSLPATPKT